MKNEDTKPEPVVVGKIYRTPWEPAGLFRVLQIEPAVKNSGESAFGVFVGNHPCGYQDGTFGRYPTKELEGRQENQK